jgi:hypothetical protein
MSKQQNSETSETYHEFSARLQIFSENDFNVISEWDNISGLVATKKGKKGDDIPERINKQWEYNYWCLESLPDIDRNEPLSKHLTWLWDQVKPNKNKLLDFKKVSGVKINIFCSYTSNCDYSGFGVDADAMKIFSELGIGLEVSTIIHRG